jgi:hypothetical protein
MSVEEALALSDDDREDHQPELGRSRPRRQAPGACPMARLKARLKAASDW